MKAYAADLGENTMITKQELDALAAATGKTAEEIKAAIAEASGHIIIEVDWQDDKG